MPEELSVETNHSLVFMPRYENRATVTTRAFVMRDFDIRYEQDLPPGLAKAHTPVEVIAVEKIALIE